MNTDNNNTVRKSAEFLNAARKFDRAGQPVTALFFKNFAWHAQQEREEFASLIPLAKAQHDLAKCAGADPLNDETNVKGELK
jgi:hypothetical protein